MKKKILLIDGHSIMNRAFYGIVQLTNSKGLHTNAILGFINIMTKAIDEEKPDYLAVAFDESAPTFRHEMFGEYKGTRHAMPDELKEQIPVIKQVLEAMGVKTVSKPGIEADDVIGTISRTAMKNDTDSVIISGDRDLLQLVTKDSVKLRLPHTSRGTTTVEDFYAEDVLKKYRVSPEGIIELKALMGDSSDNIPGVPKIGEKTATALIEKYKTIENLKDHIPEIEKKSVRETLEQNFDMAVLSKKLATIDTQAKIDFKLEDAELSDIYTREAYDMFVMLEFKSLLKRFDEEVVNTGGDLPDFALIEDENGLEDVFLKWKAADRAGFFGNEDLFALVIGGKEGTAGGFLLSGGLFKDRERFGRSLNDAINSSKAISFTDDLKVQLKQFDLAPSPKLKDIRIINYLLNPLNPDRDPVTDVKKAAFEAFLKGDESYGLIREKGMEKLLDEIEMPLVFVLSDIEREGIRADRESLVQFSADLALEIDRLHDEIISLAGQDFNINSPKQLGTILFEKMNLPGGKKTKTGYSTSAEVLDKLSGTYPIVDKILEYRGYSKLKSTYTDALADFIDEGGRIHSTFNQTVTATGRLSSDNPNMQNIPVRTERGRELRRVFVPKDGFIFVDADYSQIELRILASLSGDEKLIAAYGTGSDIHAITASQVFHVPLEEVTPALRRNAKAVNFGIVYGISSFGLSQGLSITRAEAKEYIERYFETYPGVKAYLDGLVSFAKKTGYAKTLFGRIRPIPELKDSNFMKRSFGERVAMNMPIQGTAADIMKIAMVKVHRALLEEGLDSRLVLQVHDELLVETASGEEEKVRDILRQGMMSAASLKVPLEVEINSGKDFYDAH